MPIRAGDRVAYSVAFLRATGMLSPPTWASGARGKVTRIETGLGTALVSWDGCGLATRVNVANLTQETKRAAIDKQWGVT